MKKKKIVYFVSYAFYSEKQSGFGNIEMSLTLKIKSISDIKLMNEWLCENIKDGHGEPVKAVVLNYKKLGREKRSSDGK